ncbi:MAG: hypothetical protein GY832_32245 [Chloroflexi bacterium]|nr:hypothetical protein [Chloroflexota bacterium]
MKLELVIQSITQHIQDFGLLTLNGLLEILYRSWEQGPTLLSLAAAALVMAGPDRSIQRVAGHRPRRRQRGAVVKATPVAMISTAVVTVCWTAASLLSRSPVTWWGLALWVALLIGALALPWEQENVLWTHKGLILGYAALAIGLRLIFQSPVDTSGWSELMGVEQGGASLLAMVQSSLAPWVVLTAWAIYPAGSLALLGQRLFINRMRLVNPMTSTRDTIESLRTRGETSHQQ